MTKEIVGQPASVPALSPETQAIMSLIEQIALNPQADVEKMRAVMDMKMQMFNRGAEIEFGAAMARVQAEIEPVARKAQNSQTNSAYAKLEHIIEQCSHIWTKHGFALSFGSADCPKEGYYRITCVCSHSSGHKQEYQADLPADVAGIAGKANKTGVHGFGSTMSYGRRYLTNMIFNIALKNEDRDGNRPQQQVGLNSAQVENLRKAIAAAGMTEEQFCNNKKVGIGALQDLPPARLKGAIAFLQSLAQDGVK